MRFITLLFLVFVSAAYGQDSLYYFYADKDSVMVGVRNQHHKVIISPVQYALYIDERLAIKDETIEMSHIKSPINGIKNSPVIPSGAVYNRNGDFLYSAQLFDNGMDYWEEGLRRYVEDNKIGFVNRSGEKVLSAKWDFASSFHYGYATVYEGNLYRKYDSGREYWGIGGDTVRYLINQQGERIYPREMKNHPKDYFFQGKYYPYPFNYSEEEKAVLSILDKDIIGISILLFGNAYKYSYSPVQLEIIERPSSFRNYYVITAYDKDKKTAYNSELFVEDNNVFIFDYDQNKIPLREAMVNFLEVFLAFKDRDISPETIKVAEQELKRLKSHP